MGKIKVQRQSRQKDIRLHLNQNAGRGSCLSSHLKMPRWHFRRIAILDQTGENARPYLFSIFEAISFLLKLKVYM
jgi:hypothetical protein